MITSAADQLLAARPDVVVATTELAISALAQKTSTIPIVFGIAADPVRSGFAATLQHPGRNLTGLTPMTRELAAKRLQLLQETSPHISHIALVFTSVLESTYIAEETRAAAERMKIRTSALELRRPEDIGRAIMHGASLGVQAYVVTAGGLINTQRKSIADHIRSTRLPSVFVYAAFVDAGGLMSYAPSYEENFRRAANYVDKILKGAKPGDLPIEQPTSFELVVNLGTAKAIGLKIPKSILLRADRVIE